MSSDLLNSNPLMWDDSAYSRKHIQGNKMRMKYITFWQTDFQNKSGIKVIKMQNPREF